MIIFIILVDGFVVFIGHVFISTKVINAEGVIIGIKLAIIATSCLCTTIVNKI